jgi:N-acyl homoserine lactone hydrolase
MTVATEPTRAVLPLPGGRDGATVRVHPILTGEMRAPRAHHDRPSGLLTIPRLVVSLAGLDGGWHWLPIPAFLVEHPRAGAVLIDTGLHPSCTSDPGGNLGRAFGTVTPIRMQHDQALRFQLPERGVQPKDVRVVIMTHLHVDHASAVSEFPDATFVIDRREWEAAAGGGMLQGYHQRQFDHAFDWRTLDYSADPVGSFAGFAQSLDLFGDGSVRLVSTPGHTLGHQSVVLRTAHEEILIVADAAYTERELRGEISPFLIADEHLYRRSLKEIARYREQTPSAIVIPSHDWDLWPRLTPLYG